MSRMVPRLSAFLLGALCAGCTPVPDANFGGGGQALPRWAVQGWYQDYFTSTFEICDQPTEYLPWDPVFHEPGGPDQVLMASQDCQDALLSDLKFDWDAAAKLDDGRLANDLLYIWMGAYGLMSWPLGTVDGLRDTDQTYLREPLIAELERLGAITGEDRVQALVYNMVMSSVTRTVPADDTVVSYAGKANLQTRSMTIAGCCEQIGGVDVLFHEAIHLWENRKHVACPDLGTTAETEGKLWCDADWSGPNGYQAGLLWMMMQSRSWDMDEWQDFYLYDHLRRRLIIALWLTLED